MDTWRTLPATWAASIGADIGDIAGAFAVVSLLGLLLGLADRTRRDLSSIGCRDLLALLGVAGALLAGSLLALPHELYQYFGHDTQLLGSLRIHSGTEGLPTDPGHLTDSNASRLFFVLTLYGTRLFAAAFPPTSENLTGAFQHWLPVSLMIAVLATWLSYTLSRGWGARRWSAALAVAMGALIPPILFHANSLTDHLLAALVTVAAVHLQTRRLVEGRLLTPLGLLEGLAVLGAAFYTRYTGAALLVPLALARLIAPGTSLVRRLAHTAMLGAGLGVLMLPELPRVERISPYLKEHHVFREYGSEAISLFSFENLIESISIAALADFLPPLGTPVYLFVMALGAWVLWQRGASVERRALSIVLLAFGVIVTVNFMHIHPGTRSVLLLAFFSPLFLAMGLERLTALPEAWPRSGWLMLAALGVGAVLPWVSSMNDLRADWSNELPRRFTEISETVPDLDPQEAAKQVRLWVGKRRINFLVNDSDENEDLQELGSVHDGHQANYFGQPGVLGSARFVERPTLYFTDPADFRWTTSFRRDYFIRADRAFTLLPAFHIGDKWLVFVAGPRGAPPEPWPWTRALDPPPR